VEAGSLMNSQAMWQQRDLETGGATELDPMRTSDATSIEIELGALVEYTAIIHYKVVPH